jgi:predicted O-methyltransferase YrrM
MEIGIKAAALAWETTVEVRNQNLPDSKWFNVYPGEPYRFLKSLVAVELPKLVVEIGTFTGMGCVSLLQGDEETQVHTFDVVPWHKLPSHLTPTDFEHGQVTQHLADLSSPDVFESYRALLEEADVIFLDGPKDNVFEYKFLDLLLKDPKPKEGKLLIMDDIRFVNMIPLWRSITLPKLDISSFGHWSGFGMVDISGS